MNTHASTGHWLAQLTYRLIGATPVRSGITVALTIVSQVSLMLGMLLPLKVIMLLGTDQVPDFMPEAFQAWSVKDLIFFLGGLAIVFFLLYIVAERTAVKLIDASARDILRQVNKVVLFENQNQLATNTCKKVMTSLAGLMFTLAVLIFLGFIYPLVTVALAGLILVCAPVVRQLAIYTRITRQPQLLPQHLHNINNGSFLLLFSIIVIDHLYFSAPSILITIVAIILARQISAKMVSSVIDLAQVRQNKEKVSALFFDNHILHSHLPLEGEGIWQLLETEQRRQWIGEALTQAGETNDASQLDIQWLQSGVPHIFAFWVSRQSDPDCYIVKLFDENKRTQGIHEASLLKSPTGKNLPAPGLIFNGQLRGFLVHIFKPEAGFAPLQTLAEAPALIQRFGQQLALCQPSKDISEAYTRAHPLLWQTLTVESIRPILLAATAEQRESVTQFLQKLPDIRQQLSELPTVLHNPSVTGHTLLTDQAGHLLAWQWGQWELDVFGRHLPLNAAGLEQAKDTLAAASDERWQKADLQTIELAMVMSQFERALKSQRWVDAVNLLPRALRLAREIPEAQIAGN